MKQTFLRAFTSIFFLSGMFVLLNSCTKKSTNNIPDTPPIVTLKSGDGYISSETTVHKNTTVHFGLVASKSMTNDLMKQLIIWVNYDNQPVDSFKYSINLYGPQGDTYARDFGFVTRNQGGTETYKFVITSQKGLTATASVKLDVQ